VLATELFSKKADQSGGLLRVFETKSDYVIDGSLKNNLRFIPVQRSDNQQYNLDEILATMKNTEK
jgi:hypothetical protein